MNAKYTVTLHGDFGEFGDGEEEVFAETNDWNEAKMKAARAEVICAWLNTYSDMSSKEMEKDNYRHLVSEFAMCKFQPDSKGFDAQLVEHLVKDKGFPPKKAVSIFLASSRKVHNLAISGEDKERLKYIKTIQREAKNRMTTR